MPKLTISFGENKVEIFLTLGKAYELINFLYPNHKTKGFISLKDFLDKNIVNEQ